MARQFSMAGLSLLTERPYMDKRIILSNLSATYPTQSDHSNETSVVSLTYDTRNLTTNAVEGEVPILWMAGETNKKVFATDSRDSRCIEGFEYPYEPGTSTPVNNCYGLAVLNEPTDCTIVFLSEPIASLGGYPVLFHMKYDPDGASAAERFYIDNYYVVNTSAGGSLFTLDSAHRGMTEYKGDLMVLGMISGVNSVIYMDKFGQPLAHYPSFTTEDDIRGLMYLHKRVFTTMDGTADPNIGSRYLAKFKTDTIDQSRMIPIVGVEPFFFDAYEGDVSLYQDRMVASDRGTIYIYKMLYFMFIVDDVPNDDIDMGSVLIGDSKVKRVVLKNIADYYQLGDVTISKNTPTCPGGDTYCPATEAVDWVTFSTTDPETSSDPGIWTDTITMAPSGTPAIKPDGEVEFWVKIDVPAEYTNITESGDPADTNKIAVGVDDGPFVVEMNVTARVG